MENQATKEELLDNLAQIEKKLEINKISAEIRKLEKKRAELSKVGDVEVKDKSIKDMLHQQLQLLAERSKTCPHEIIFSLTTAMLDIAIYISSN